MTVAITGASGQLGRLVADKLLAAVDPADVVLLSRSPESLSEFAIRGAQTRRADFVDAASLPGAFAGVERLLLISTDTVGDRVAGHVAAITAAAAAGVRHIVYTSVPEPTEANPALVVPDHRATEDALRASGLTWTFLRNNLYSDMQSPTIAHAAASGKLVTNVGDGRAAYVTRDDCAAAAVGALTANGTECTVYDITGPQAVSANELAQLAGAAVEVVNVDDATYEAGLVEAGLPAEVARLLASFGASIRESYLSTVSSAVFDLTGHQPTSLAASDGPR